MIGHAEKAAAKDAISKFGRIWRAALFIAALALLLALISRPAFQMTIGNMRYTVERVTE